MPVCVFLLLVLLAGQASSAQQGETGDTSPADAKQPEPTEAAFAPDFAQEIVDITLSDGVVTRGRLTLPPPPTEDDNEGAGDEAHGTPAPVGTLVIYVQGTGPGTYLLNRDFGNGPVSYFDPFAQAFADRGIAFFSYNKRGVTNSDTPPWYDAVDREAFRQVVPDTEADDLATIVESLKQHTQLGDARVVLIGWSEGTVVAALAAERRPDLIDAVMLAGYAHENMFDVIAYQFEGHGSMLKLNPVFDADGDGGITRDEYESDDESVARWRRGMMQDAPFDVLDVSKDGVLKAEDFAALNKPMHVMLLDNIEQNNEDWIWDNYFRVSIPWLHGHFALEANKTRLLRMDLPIYIFHGADDAHVPAAGVEDLESRFKTLGKTNLEARILADHDHDLNYVEWVRSGQMTEGIRAIIEAAEAFNEGQPPD